MQLILYQVDAFADQLFKGNPAAVVPLENWLSAQTMQQIAAENNLSETAFFVPSEEDFELRWFTPNKEVNLCGHATLAAAHVLFEHLNYDKKVIRFHTQSGWLSVEKEENGLSMTFPTDQINPIEINELLQQSVNHLPIQAAFRGRDDILVVIEKESDLRELTPNFSAIEQLEARGIIVTAPGETEDFVSRCFYPRYGILEDPVTGSAHTTMLPYWAKVLNRNELVAKQLSVRTGKVLGTFMGETVLLKGQSVTYLIGHIQLPGSPVLI